MQAWLFDMDGTLFNSMPFHAVAWEQVMHRHGLTYTQADCYRGEGKRGEDVIRECIRTQLHREPQPQEVKEIYNEKSEMFVHFGNTAPIDGVAEVLECLQKQGHQLWIVTGSAQQSLFDRLDECFPHIFTRQRMITASDVKHGKPSPDPYLTAWQRTGLNKADCRVVENAPLGVQSGKAAGLYTIAVNTGPLPDSDLRKAGADQVFKTMQQLKQYILQ